MHKTLYPNGEVTVQVKLSMTHLGIDYTMTREQKYTTNSSGALNRPNNTVFKIQYRNTDGQQEFVKDTEVDLRMKEILPKELAKYFFFDGERIGNMSKEIRKGKSKEFADAVKSLLGLSAFTEALDHLGEGQQQLLSRVMKAIMIQKVILKLHSIEMKSQIMIPN